MEFIIIILKMSLGVFIFFFIKNMFWSKEQNLEKENNKRLENSMKEEYLYDGETRTKITIEEATSGNWISSEHENNPINTKELEIFFTFKDEQYEKSLNYLKKKYTSHSKLSNEVYDYLNELYSTEHYINWHYSDLFIIDNKHMIFSIIFSSKIKETNAPSSIERSTPRFFLWLNLNLDVGHYKLVVTDFSNEVISRVFYNEPFDLENYNTYKIKETTNKHKLKQILKTIDYEKDLDIILKNKYIFIKTRNNDYIDDIKKLERIISGLKPFTK